MMKFRVETTNGEELGEFNTLYQAERWVTSELKSDRLRLGKFNIIYVYQKRCCPHCGKELPNEDRMELD